MENSKLIHLFKHLTSKERKELGKFLQSPFVNQQEELIKLYEFLIKNIDGRQKKIDKKVVFEKVYPNQTFTDVKMRLCMSGLFKMIEQFLVYNHMIQDKIKSKIALASIYGKRNLESHCERTLKDLNTLQNKENIRNAEYYNNNYLIQQEEYRLNSKQKRTAEMNLQSLSDSNDLVYLSTKLKNSCFILSHQRVYKTEYHFGLLDAAIQFIEANDLLKHPAISIYYYCYQSLLYPEKDHYFLQFKQIMLDHEDYFPKEEIRDLYILSINYCIKRVNENKHDYIKVGLDLYKSGLKNAFLIEDNRISRFTFNNIVAMALKMKEYEWARAFIEQYDSYLEKKYRDSTVSFNLARLNYEIKSYDEALKHLQLSDFKDLLNNLIAKSLMMKIYYELSEIDLLDSHLDTMRIFIKRKNVIGYHQKNYLNIIHFTKKLVGLNPYDRKEKLALREAIFKEEILTEKEWLLEMIG